MAKEKQITLKIPAKYAEYVYNCLNESQSGYTEGDSVPERIKIIRGVMEDLNDEIFKYTMSLIEDYNKS